MELRRWLVNLSRRLGVALLVDLLVGLLMCLGVCLRVWLWAGLRVHWGSMWQQIVVVWPNLLLLLLNRLYGLRLKRLHWLDLLRYRLGLWKLLNWLYWLRYLL